jgi:hypothetical protein
MSIPHWDSDWYVDGHSAGAVRSSYVRPSIGSSGTAKSG